MSAPFSASLSSSRLSIAASRPTSGSAPAPRPRVTFAPMWIFDVGVGHQERLGVGVHGDELDAAQARVDHAVDGVGAAAADADDLDDGEIRPAGLLHRHRWASSTIVTRTSPSTSTIGLTLERQEARCRCDSADVAVGPKTPGRGVKATCTNGARLCQATTIELVLTVMENSHGVVEVVVVVVVVVVLSVVVPSCPARPGRRSPCRSAGSSAAVRSCPTTIRPAQVSPVVSVEGSPFFGRPPGAPARRRPRSAAPRGPPSGSAPAGARRPRSLVAASADGPRRMSTPICSRATSEPRSSADAHDAPAEVVRERDDHREPVEGLRAQEHRARPRQASRRDDVRQLRRVLSVGRVEHPPVVADDRPVASGHGDRRWTLGHDRDLQRRGEGAIDGRVLDVRQGLQRMLEAARGDGQHGAAVDHGHGARLAHPLLQGAGRPGDLDVPHRERARALHRCVAAERDERGEHHPRGRGRDPARGPHHGKGRESHSRDLRRGARASCRQAAGMDRWATTVPVRSYAMTATGRCGPCQRHAGSGTL